MKLVPESLNEAQEFQKGQDPKRAMGIGIEPFDMDELQEAWDNSNLGNLTGGGGGWEGDMDSLIEPLVDEEGLTDEQIDAQYEHPTKLRIYGNIDHPMSGYGGSYNEADVDLTAERLPGGKIHVYGEITKSYGRIEKEDEDDDYGDRIHESTDKPEEIDFEVDDVEELMEALEEMPQ